MLTTAPTLDHLYNLFPDSPDRPDAVEVPGGELPQPYHRLLVHAHHMTVTIEEFYRSAVDVQVLSCRRSGNEYARKILLKARAIGEPIPSRDRACSGFAEPGETPRRGIGRDSPTGRIVQFGLVRINLGVCPELVRNEIVEGKTPLGRVLIRHDMLRRIEPVAYLRVRLSAEMAGWFDVEPGTTTFGRLGVIYTGDRPAVEVLEILAPIPSM